MMATIIKDETAVVKVPLDSNLNENKTKPLELEEPNSKILTVTPEVLSPKRCRKRNYQNDHFGQEYLELKEREFDIQSEGFSKLADAVQSIADSLNNVADTIAHGKIVNK